MSKKFRFFIFLFFIISYNTPLTFARWGSEGDAPIVIEYFNQDISVNETGQIEQTDEILIKILNEEGRKVYGTQNLFYNSTNEKLDVLEAKTVFDLNPEKINLLSQGRSFKDLNITTQDLDPTMKEDRPVASQNLSFDHNNLVTLSYPNATVNSWVYLKLKKTISQPPLPQYFSTSTNYGQGGIWHKSTITIRSKLPFKTKVHDLENHLCIKEFQDKGLQTLIVTQNKPIMRFLINEPQNIIQDEQKSIFFHVSTHPDYKVLGEQMAAQYDAILDKSLPAKFEAILKEAKDKTNEIEQINMVTSGLMNSIRYMSDLRTIKGRIVPQSFDDVAFKEVGDCKDSAALTAKILRLLGYEAYVCLIYREDIYKDSALALPNLGIFNHAIVKVITSSGEVHWIDPTNEISMAGNIFEDISDRNVLVLKTGDATLEKTPPVNPEDSEMSRDEIITFDKQKNMLHRRGKLTLKGQKAQGYTALNFSTSKENIEHILIQELSQNNDVEKYTIKRDELKSRNVKPVTIEFDYEQNDDSPFSNEGHSFSLASMWPLPFLNTSIHQEGISFLNFPATLTQSRLLENCEGDNLKALECDLKYPWFEASRTCEIEPNGIRVTEKIVLLKSFITPEKIRSPEFKKIKQDIRKYFGNTLLVFSQKTKSQK